MSDKTVFVINSGSSSVKYKLLDPEKGNVLASGLAERIGEDEGHIRHTTPEGTWDENEPLADHDVALRRVIRLFEKHGPNLDQSHVVGVGHRVVQGGAYFDKAALIDEDVHQKIADLCPMAPLHNPAHLLGINVAMEIWPNLPHVAVFDTAFFAKLPDACATYALEKETAKKYQIRRYGAHGTSHQFVSDAVCNFLGKDDIRQVTLHLGNGASITAEKGRIAQDTSMGLTPLEGLVMGTRTGDIDPAVVFHLIRVGKMDVEQLDTLFNKQSGMKGLCGDNDMRQVWARIESGDKDAKLAMDVYIHRLLKYVGAYTAVLGGLDVISFTAGIGENDSSVRSRLCKDLAYMGVELDQEANAKKGEGIREISTPSSKVKVLVVPTDEELAIARQVMELVKA